MTPLTVWLLFIAFVDIFLAGLTIACGLHGDWELAGYFAFIGVLFTAVFLFLAPWGW